MAIELSTEQARSIRMRSLLLAPESSDASLTFRNPSEAIHHTVQHLMALQGQDFSATRYALGVRNQGATLDDVNQAFNDGYLVRSWPMRGTVHTVAAENIDWMQQLTNHRVLKDAPKRRAYLGMPDALVDQAADVTERILSGGRQLTREALSVQWAEHGLVTESNWRYHLIWYLAQIGLITMGPIQENSHLIVLAHEWIKNPRKLQGEEALAELATGFVRGRGPVTVVDFAWWTGLTMGESKKAFALAEVVEVNIAGVAQFVVDESVLELANEAIATASQISDQVLLLGAFDEHLLGYKNRDWALSPDHLSHLVPGRNGVFRPTIVHNGEVIGLWRRKPLELDALPGYASRMGALDTSAVLQRVTEFFAE